MMSQPVLRSLLGGRFFTVTFTKADGTSRVLTGRLGVTKYVKGTGTTKPKPAGLMTVWERGNGGQYRSFYINRITELRCNGLVITGRF